MTNNTKEIFYAFNGKLVGSKFMKKCVCETLTFMTPEIIDFITSNCWFFSSLDDAWAFTFTGNDLKDNHLIFLSDDLLKEDKSQIYYSIAHEIGHVMLNHRNSTLVKQNIDEIKMQEKEADLFAKQFIY